MPPFSLASQRLEGRRSVPPAARGDRSKVQSSPRLTAGPRVIPLGGTSAGPGVPPRHTGRTPGR